MDGGVHDADLLRRISSASMEWMVGFMMRIS
jgi:hypothetical protein